MVEIIKKKMNINIEEGRLRTISFSDHETEKEQTTDDYLLEQIISVTQSPKSAPFYRSAIKKLGPTGILPILSEVVDRNRLGTIRSPAKYFTTCLNQRLKNETSAQAPSLKISSAPRNTFEKRESHFCATQIELFQELSTPFYHPNIDSEENFMMDPYFKKFLPWPTFVGPNFFTLSTNHIKSDALSVEFRSMDAKSKKVPMIRGRIKPGAAAYGILTADHARVLGGLIVIWIRQGGKFGSVGKHGERLCYCYVNIRELAACLGWNSFCGQAMNHLVNRIQDLATMPYYIDMISDEEFKLAKLKSFGFKFLGEVTYFKKGQGGSCSLFYVTFSTPLSNQLLKRRVVSRPIEMLYQSSELAFLVRMYLEPRLLGPREYPGIETGRLIQELNLPPAQWHHTGWRRKQIFEDVVIKSLNGKNTHDGRRFELGIEKGLRDYILTANLKGAPLSSETHLNQEIPFKSESL